jgi:hypothetical protein
MEIDKRAFVADLYPGPGWKTKVAKMPDEQVTAIFLREQAKAQQHTRGYSRVGKFRVQCLNCNSLLPNDEVDMQISNEESTT